MFKEPLPIFDESTKQVFDGIYFPLPTYCKKHYSEKCSKFYEGISNNVGFHICPFGFTVYVKKIGTKFLVHTGLRVDGHYNKKKANPKIVQKYNHPIFSLQDFENLLEESEKISNYYLKIVTDHKAFTRRIGGIEEKTNELSKFVSSTMHEIRKLNVVIKKQAEDASRSFDYNNLDQIKNRIDNIFSTSSLISIRLNSFDLLINPMIVNSADKKEMGVYSKFEKVSHCLETFAYEKHLNVGYSGNSYSKIKALEIFEILPYLIYENAIKYSPQNQYISTNFEEDQDYIIVVVKSMGPHVNKSEVPRLFEKDFRGKHALSANTSGTGIGLHIAKQICDLHDFEISVSSSPKTSNIGDIPFSNFVVSLKIPKS